MGKNRVFELAKELGVNSKVLLEKMQQMGLPARSHMSTLEDGEIRQIKEAFKKKEGQSRPLPKARDAKTVKTDQQIKTPGPGSAARNDATSRTAQQQGPARPARPSGPARPTQAPGPRPAQTPRPGAAPAQTGKPARPPQKGGAAGSMPSPGMTRSTATAGAGRTTQAPGPRPAQATTAARTTQNKTAQAPGPRPAQAQGPARPSQKPASRPPQKPGPARTSQPSRPAGTGDQAAAKKTAGAADSKVAVGREDYRKKVLERREEQRRTQEQSQRKLLSKVVSLPGRGQGKRRRKPMDHHHHHQPAVSVLPKEISIEEQVTVQDLANRLQVDPGVVIKKLIELGVMATLNQAIDADTATLVAQDFGANVEVEKAMPLEAALEEDEENEDVLEMRPPVITVMGHVDHGKTSLLDSIRQTNVIATEAGGITQHIGAYQVELKGKKITFLDTPGHEAFTSMRARGAQVTDIAVLVVAADDGVMPQTVEAINHAKAAGVPIVVAVNKIDKPQANPDRVKQQLTEYSLVPEEWGGSTICVPVSAATKEGIEQLLEMLLLVAEMEEFKSNPNRTARGTVIDARLDRGRGPVATVLIQKGTLHVGDYTLAGTAYGRIRAMLDFKGRRLKKAPPATPVEILGLSEVPNAGDPFYVLPDEKLARQIVDERVKVKRQQGNVNPEKVSLEDLFKQIQQGKVKELNLIVKADVHGSVEALLQTLSKLGTSEVRLCIIHSGVGAVTENDVMLASASNALIIGFNVRPDENARRTAEMQQVEIRLYRVIYEILDDVKAALEGLLEPELREVATGRAEVRDIFSIPKIGAISGCYVTEGKIQRNAKVRVIRDGVVVYEGAIASLRRFKDDVKEVQQGYECGIGLEKFQDVKQGDVIEAYTIEEIKRAL
jgi:translation initiation factor IF-2